MPQAGAITSKCRVHTYVENALSPVASSLFKIRVRSDGLDIETEMPSAHTFKRTLFSMHASDVKINAAKVRAWVVLQMNARIECCKDISRLGDAVDKARNIPRYLLLFTDSRCQLPVPRSERPSRQGQASSLQPFPSPV